MSAVSISALLIGTAIGLVCAFIPPASAEPTDSKESSVDIKKAPVSEAEAPQPTRGRKVKQAEEYYRRGQHFYQARDFEKAEQYMRLALEIDQNLKPEQHVDTLIALGIVLVAARRTDEALEIYRTALKVSETKKLPYTSVILDSMGTLLFSAGKIDDAAEYYKKALSVAVSSADVVMQSRALINQAHLETVRGNQDNARELVRKADVLIKEAKDVDGSTILLIARMQRNLNQLPVALANYHRALKCLNNIDNDYSVVVGIQLGIAEICVEIGDIGGARASYEIALQLSQNGDPRDYVRSLIGLASTEVAKREFKSAEEHLLRARQEAKKLGFVDLEEQAALYLDMMSRAPKS